MKGRYVPLIVLILLFSCVNDANEFIDENPPNLRELSFQEESLVNSSNEFVFDLFDEINKRETSGNFFFSPLSVQYALGMTMNGADGTTLESIKSVLKNEELNEDEINKAYQSLTEFLLNIDKKVMVKIANSVWYKDQYSVNEEFENTVESYYDAEVSALDFSDPVAKDIINGWVETKTEDLIRDLIDNIPGDAVMYLINAIYYKADWQYQFDKELTEKRPFYLESGSEVSTDMMVSEGAKIRYWRNDNIRLIDIPYGNGQYSMTILIPALEHSLEAILNELTAEDFGNWINQSDTATSRLSIPKFKIEYKSLLNDHLSALGMEVAFTGGADFSRLFTENLDLMISRVIHQAVIEVNEEGSEAAAATAVEIVETSLPPEPQEITINRPFVFFIREKHSDTILFAGKLMDPTE